MKNQNQTAHAVKPLAYRLRRGVHDHEAHDRPYLVLDFPLKAVLIHPTWMPVFRLLSKGKSIRFEEVCSLMAPASPDKVETFLNDLVRKGFLDREGLSTWAIVPSVTVIIPVRNRPQEIKSCLDSLSRLDYPKEKLEIIVVDDASTDNTPDEVARFPVTLISLKEHRQASFCRNEGARLARGDILAFIDSDCTADSLWLRELIPAFNEASVGVVGGLVDSFAEENALDRYEKVRSSLKVGSWFRRSSEEDTFFYVPSCNLLTRRHLFLNLGGFREELHVGEDVDLCWRMQDLGYQVEYRPAGRIYHRHRNQWSEFCRRRFDYGTSEPLLQRLHKKRMKHLTFPLAESFFWSLVIVAVLLGSFPLFLLPWITGILHALIHRRQLSRLGIAIPFHSLVMACFRSYFAFLYLCCAFVSRYYLVLAPLLAPGAPLASAVIVCMHLLTAVGECTIKKPPMHPFAFLAAFSMEQLSYQLGVWWGCLKGWYFGPVNPRLLLGRET